MTPLATTALPSVGEWRAALLAALEVAEEALSRGAGIAQERRADSKEMSEEHGWITESRARLDRLRPLLVDPSPGAVLSRDPSVRVFDNGHVDTIRPQIPAVVFGRWAAHPSVDFPPAVALTVDGGADLATQRVGWVVTHVATGCTLPASLVDGLRQEQAEAIACALEEAGNCACDLDAAALLQTKDVIAQVVYETLAGLSELEDALDETRQWISDELPGEKSHPQGESG